MAKVENLDAPIGWLIDPHNKWAIHFDYKKVTNDQIGNDFTIDMWGVVPNGKPMIFKSRRKATRQDSMKTWKQLISSNWVELDIEKTKSA
ncbi:DUF1651 domain-containing protein [Prochlorococcus marinus]|uniref:Uncharacterized protein n=1 Tax=Prochlorococcus marinus XMU1408 TaxID=2213228 RepID=A0A318R3R9_PROMR|nr:DUF1651 domain-containing protein [Prochlorococcus marinus]MBW3041717.1 hypothetical protein [Prochlorococcus marinus str. XMU1408]PYE02864.1 hypothetical protein DNJ73_03705 [Prochlorococcus marinus XMU1408]